MESTASQIQIMLDNKENHYQSQQDIISDLSQDNYELHLALKDILSKIKDTQPDLVLKYMSLNG